MLIYRLITFICIFLTACTLNSDKTRHSGTIYVSVSAIPSRLSSLPVQLAQIDFHHVNGNIYSRAIKKTLDWGLSETVFLSSFTLPEGDYAKLTYHLDLQQSSAQILTIDKENKTILMDLQLFTLKGNPIPQKHKRLTIESLPQQPITIKKKHTHFYHLSLLPFDSINAMAVPVLPALVFNPVIKLETANTINLPVSLQSMTDYAMTFRHGSHHLTAETPEWSINGIEIENLPDRELPESKSATINISLDETQAIKVNSVNITTQDQFIGVITPGLDGEELNFSGHRLRHGQLLEFIHPTTLPVNQEGIALPFGQKVIFYAGQLDNTLQISSLSLLDVSIIGSVQRYENGVNYLLPVTIAGKEGHAFYQSLLPIEIQSHPSFKSGDLIRLTGQFEKTSEHVIIKSKHYDVLKDNTQPDNVNHPITLKLTFDTHKPFDISMMRLHDNRLPLARLENKLNIAASYTDTDIRANLAFDQVNFTQDTIFSVSLSDEKTIHSEFTEFDKLLTYLTPLLDQYQCQLIVIKGTVKHRQFDTSDLLIALIEKNAATPHTFESDSIDLSLAATGIESNVSEKGGQTALIVPLAVAGTLLTAGSIALSAYQFKKYSAKPSTMTLGTQTKPMRLTEIPLIQFPEKKAANDPLFAIRPIQDNISHLPAYNTLIKGMKITGDKLQTAEARQIAFENKKYYLKLYKDKDTPSKVILVEKLYQLAGVNSVGYMTYRLDKRSSELNHKLYPFAQITQWNESLINLDESGYIRRDKKNLYKKDRKSGIKITGETDNKIDNVISYNKRQAILARDKVQEQIRYIAVLNAWLGNHDSYSNAYRNMMYNEKSGNITLLDYDLVLLNPLSSIENKRSLFETTAYENPPIINDIQDLKTGFKKLAQINISKIDSIINSVNGLTHEQKESYKNLLIAKKVNLLIKYEPDTDFIDLTEFKIYLHEKRHRSPEKPVQFDFDDERVYKKLKLKSGLQIPELDNFFQDKTAEDHLPSDVMRAIKNGLNKHDKLVQQQHHLITGYLRHKSLESGSTERHKNIRALLAFDPIYGTTALPDYFSVKYGGDDYIDRLFSLSDEDLDLFNQYERVLIGDRQDFDSEKSFTNYITLKYRGKLPTVALSAFEKRQLSLFSQSDNISDFIKPDLLLKDPPQQKTGSADKNDYKIIFTQTDGMEFKLGLKALNDRANADFDATHMETFLVNPNIDSRKARQHIISPQDIYGKRTSSGFVKENQFYNRR